ncbi:MAG: glycoside hydrolase family 88 protein [Ignavibacteriae bacterium]|nr:glycoside hydrolase family 88 protein [Ignavibacteriota bacterium]
MKRLIFIIILFISISTNAQIENSLNPEIQISPKLSWSERIAQSFVLRHPGSVTYDKYMTKNNWNYEQGVMLEAMKKMYEFTGDLQYYKFIKENINQFVNDNGEIKTYKISEFNIDHINAGRALLYLYENEKLEKYKFAIDSLRKQIELHPRTLSGGFWHKKIYPYQMWLDGLFMAQPFYANYSQQFKEDNFDDIFKQFNLMYEKTFDEKTELLHHAWNENKEQKWADKVTGKSQHFWGRSIGWYLMAIVETLDIIDENDSRRNNLINILQNVSEALLKFRDCKTGLWYQIIDMPEREGNYLEASCAAMFTYVFAKGVNKNYLDKKFLVIAKENFYSIIEYHVKIDENGFVNLFNTCAAAGLGGKPYRDGSFAYYISEPTRINDFKGYGPLIYSAIELEKAKVLSK